MTSQERVLIVDDEEQMRELLAKVLEKNGYQVAAAGDGAQALALLEKEPVDLVVTDVRMPGLGGMEALKSIKELNPDIIVIIMTAFGSIDQAVQAVKEGAYDYINKPFKIDEMLLTIGKALEERRLRHEVTALRHELRTRYHFESLIGKGRAMQEVFGLIEQVAGSRSTVMIYGKSGTGKELVAKAVQKGAFTGAIATKVGKFELATGGSLFLDEVGSMRLDLQAKILRALQEREVERVGGTRTIKIDVRVIAATNRDLKRAVEEGTFREDLYYRLNVVPITLPDLKDRQEDIPLLANHFMQKFAQESNSAIREISKDAMGILLSYPWPGNVRELENVIERAVTLGRGPAILPTDLPPHLAGGAGPVERALAQEATLEDLERDYIRAILQRTKWHQIRTAAILGIDRRTLYRKIRRYGIKSNDQ
ncbi:MAG: sigma-54-dependent Fis family transcriptional regulator [candidate division NC10 bacterium]|nr:sigma-54-dependent Fis family transcriptional regulator [candidate division NC10 bacterium]